MNHFTLAAHGAARRRNATKRLAATLGTALALLLPAGPAGAASAGADAQPAAAGRAQDALPARSAQSPLELGEAAYRARRYDAAMEQFGVAAAAHDHPFAWLRIGNIWHRRGQVALAMHAYGRARDAAAALGQQRGVRERAVMNIALLSLDQARQALDALGQSAGSDAERRWRTEVGIRLRDLLDQVDAPGTAPRTPADGAQVAAPAVSMQAPAALRR